MKFHKWLGAGEWIRAGFGIAGLTITSSSTQYKQTFDLGAGAAGASFSCTTGAVGAGLGGLITITTSNAYGLGAIGVGVLTGEGATYREYQTNTSINEE